MLSTCFFVLLLFFLIPLKHVQFQDPALHGVSVTLNVQEFDGHCYWSQRMKKYDCLNDINVKADLLDVISWV